jgi:hypothetical protein
MSESKWEVAFFALPLEGEKLYQDVVTHFFPNHLHLSFGEVYDITIITLAYILPMKYSLLMIQEETGTLLTRLILCPRVLVHRVEEKLLITCLEVDAKHIRKWHLRGAKAIQTLLPHRPNLLKASEWLYRDNA